MLHLLLDSAFSKCIKNDRKISVDLLQAFKKNATFATAFKEMRLF